MSARELLARAAATTVVTRVFAAGLTISAAGIGGIVAHEGMVREVYLDPIGIPTVCAGHIQSVKLSDVGKKFSEETCNRLLLEDTADAQAGVKRLVKAPITQHQYDALVSFTFNVGTGALSRSTLLRKLNAGDECGAAAEFPKWDYAGGRKLRGLTLRRLDEQRTFLTGLTCPGIKQ
jgi:lysozyme